MSLQKKYLSNDLIISPRDTVTLRSLNKMKRPRVEEINDEEGGVGSMGRCTTSRRILELLWNRSSYCCAQLLSFRLIDKKPFPRRKLNLMRSQKDSKMS